MSLTSFVLILLWHSTGGYGIESVAISQQVYVTQAACENAAKAARTMNKDHLDARCVPSNI